MKRLIHILMIVMGLALAMTAHAEPRRHFAGFGFFGGGGDSGGVALSNTTDWALASRVVTTDEGGIQLSALINTDSFNDSSLGAMWNSSTGGSGTITETGSYLLINSPAAATDAAYVCYAETLNPRASKNYRMRVKAEVIGAGAERYYGNLEMSAYVPIVNTLAASNFNSMPVVSWQSSALYHASTRNGAGAFEYWVPSDADGWNTTAFEAYFAVDVGEVWIHEIENDGTNFYINLYDTNDVLYSRAIRPLASAQAEANDTYFCFGDPYTNLYDGALKVTGFWHYGDFRTDSPTATMGQITVGSTITRVGLFENCESGATITWDYDIGAGWVTGSTLAQLSTALVGTAPATLNLRANFNSNGTANCTIYSDGASITG